MANLSDIIEQFILSALEGGDKLEIGRNELATHFSVAPSQINYVLSTRFTVDKGYVIESRRGGGGYIVVARLNDDCINTVNEMLNYRTTLSYREGVNLLERLEYNNLITGEQSAVIKAVISDKALNNPFNIADNLRLSIMREILIKLMIDRQQQND